MTEHVHSRSCDRVAFVRLTDERGQTTTRNVIAWCSDDEASIRRHVARWHPAARFVSVTFTR